MLWEVIDYNVILNNTDYYQDLLSNLFHLRIKENHCSQNAEVEDSMNGDLENEEGSNQNSDPEDSTGHRLEAIYSNIDSITPEVKNESELEVKEGIHQGSETYYDNTEDSLEVMYSTIDIATAECVAYHSNFPEVGTDEGNSTVAYDDP